MFYTQPAQHQDFTAHKNYFYRCFLPDLTGFKIHLLRKAENINTAYEYPICSKALPPGFNPA